MILLSSVSTRPPKNPARAPKVTPMTMATSATTRVRFARYGKGAVHEWMVTVDETLIVTKGALLVRSEGSVQIARAGEVISLAKGTRVVYRGEEDGTEVVFVSYSPRLQSPQHLHPATDQSFSRRLALAG